MEPSLDPDTQYLVRRLETKELDSAIVNIEQQIQDLEVREGVGGKEEEREGARVRMRGRWEGRGRMRAGKKRGEERDEGKKGGMKGEEDGRERGEASVMAI